MADLSNRQLVILKSIIDEYIETAEPVASETLDKKYNLGVSPATIRNEMAELEAQDEWPVELRRHPAIRAMPAVPRCRSVRQE